MKIKCVIVNGVKLTMIEHRKIKRLSSIFAKLTFALGIGLNSTIAKSATSFDLTPNKHLIHQKIAVSNPTPQGEQLIASPQQIEINNKNAAEIVKRFVRKEFTDLATLKKALFYDSGAIAFLEAVNNGKLRSFRTADFFSVISEKAKTNLRIAELFTLTISYDYIDNIVNQEYFDSAMLHIGESKIVQRNFIYTLTNPNLKRFAEKHLEDFLKKYPVVAMGFMYAYTYGEIDKKYTPEKNKKLAFSHIKTNSDVAEAFIRSADAGFFKKYVPIYMKSALSHPRVAIVFINAVLDRTGELFKQTTEKDLEIALAQIPKSEELATLFIHSVKLGKLTKHAKKYMKAAAQKAPLAATSYLIHEGECVKFRQYYHDIISGVLTWRDSGLDKIRRGEKGYDKNGYKSRLFYLKLLRVMNSAHSAPPEERARLTGNLTGTELYNLVTYGYSEIFESTYKKYIYPEILRQVRKSGLPLINWLNRIDPSYTNMPGFLYTSVKFNTIKDLTDGVSKEELKRFLEKVIEVGTKKNNQMQTLAIVRIGLELPNNLRDLWKGIVLKYLQKALDLSYTKHSLTVVARAYKTIHPNDPDFAQFKKLELPKYINEEDYFTDKVSVARVMFYFDADATSSFKHFVQTFKSNGFEIEYLNEDDEKTTLQKAIYAIFSKKKNSKTIKIYVNMPTKDGFSIGAKQIEGLLKTKYAFVPIEIFRGHSYNQERTHFFDRIVGNPRFVFTGACGSADKVASLTARYSTHPAISGTTGEGTKFVNDPLLLEFFNTILNLKPGEKMLWDTFWEGASEKINDHRMQSYINPSKYIDPIIIRELMGHKDKVSVK